MGFIPQQQSHFNNRARLLGSEYREEHSPRSFSLVAKYPNTNMSKFQIIVVNDSSLQKNFTIFNDFPQKSTNKGEPRQNVWAVSPLVNSAGGSTTFSITENYYAVCGMSPRKIAEGVEVSSQNQVSVILSSNTSKGTMVPMEAKSAGVFFDKGKLGQDNTPGTYKIETASWDTGEYG